MTFGFLIIVFSILALIAVAPLLRDHEACQPEDDHAAD